MVSRSLSRIWERDEESDCRWSSKDSIDDQYNTQFAKNKQFRDDVSSESSLFEEEVDSYQQDGSQINKFKYFDFNQLLEDNYRQAYIRFEQAALARKHIATTYNFNPNSSWH